MPDAKPLRGRWFDRWLCSDSEELLELEGATPNGVAIINELNEIYSHTGLTKRIIDLLIREAARLYAKTGRPVRILELGMRDGAVLQQVYEQGVSAGVPMQLHGLEFRKDISDYAAQRLEDAAVPVEVSDVHSRISLTYATGHFDIVYSMFVFHHGSTEDFGSLLSESIRVSNSSVFHLDLARSFSAFSLLWLFYFLKGYRRSRKDALLSVRRSFRRQEVAVIIRNMGLEIPETIGRFLPFYWLITYRRERDTI